MGIKRKEIDLLLELNKNSISVKELSEKLQENERNLRYSIENLDYYLNISLNSKITKNNKKLSILLTEEQVDSFLCYIREGGYIYNSVERCEYILFNFLFEEAPKLKDIEEHLEVTRTTLKKDMRLLEDELEKYELKFIIEGNKVSIGGNEKKLRHLMMIKMMKYSEIKGIESKYPMEAKLKGKILIKNSNILKLSKQMLDIIEEKLNESFSKEFKKIMEYYLWVTFFRIDKGIYIEKKSNEEFLRKTDQYLILKEILKDIMSDYDYEYLHLTEYFLSGSSEKEYYEERIAIELFTYGMLVSLGKILEENIFTERLFKEIIGYLTSAIYRMKNNFVLKSDRLEIYKGNIYNLVEKVCREDRYLSEKLREEEIEFMAKLIGSSMEEDKDKILEMGKILEIVRKSAKEVDEDSIKKDLLEEYGRWIRAEEEPKMMEEEQLIIKVENNEPNISRENFLKIVNETLKKDKRINSEILIEECEESSIFKENKTTCYYLTNFEKIEKSSILIIELEKKVNNMDRVIFLALKDEIIYLKALLELSIIRLI